MSVIEELRHATRTDHDAVERLVDIGRADFDTLDYAAFLEAMLAAHEPFERALANVPELAVWLPDVASRAKASLLRQDLRQLGRDPAEAPAVPTSTAHALGALYVLEGSTLGARFVLARLRPHLGDEIAEATRYLEAYGESRSQRWQVFTSALDRAAEDPMLRGGIVAGAASMFGRVRELLSEALPTRGIKTRSTSTPARESQST